MTSGHASVKLRCAPGPTVVVNILRTDGANVAGALDRAACLFFGDVADYGQFEHLALIRLDKEEQPDREFRDRDQRPNKQAEQSHEGNRGDHRKSNPQDDASHAEEQGLKGVETDKTVTVVRLYHEENDRRNDSDIGEKARNVIGEAVDGALVAVATAVPPPADWALAFPQALQVTEPSAIAAPQEAQNAA